MDLCVCTLRTQLMLYALVKVILYASELHEGKLPVKIGIEFITSDAVA